jgi:hypothetical protein
MVKFHTFQQGNDVTKPPFFNDEQCNNVQTLIVNLLKLHVAIESHLQQQNTR